MLKKFGILTLVTSCVATFGITYHAHADPETPEDLIAFQRALEKGDPMNPDFRFKRDTATIYAACESNWWVEFSGIRDCYRNGMEEIAKGTQFADLIIKSCEMMDRNTPDLLIHPFDWDAISCAKKVAEVVHYPKLDEQIKLCEKWFWRRWERASCLYRGIRGMEDGEETRPKSEKSEMSASIGGQEEKAILKTQIKIPDRSYMDKAKVAALIGACKATNTADTETFFGKLSPNPATTSTNEIITKEEFLKIDSSIADLFEKAKKGEKLSDEKRKKIYDPQPDPTAKLELVTPLQPKPVHVDWSKFQGGNYNVFTAKHDWSTSKKALNDQLYTAKSLAQNLYSQVTTLPYSDLAKKAISEIHNPMPTNIQESHCYRDGLKAIGQGKDLPTMLLDACNGLWPLAGDQKNRCLRAGMIASNLSGLSGGAQDNCDKNKIIFKFTGDIWHFLNGAFGTSCYEDVVIASHKGESETQKNQTHVSTVSEKGDLVARDAARKYMGNKFVDEAAMAASSARDRDQDTHQVQ